MSVDPKDVSPAWKVLKMKLKEEKQSADLVQQKNDKDDSGFTKVVSKKEKQMSRKRKLQEALRESETSSKRSNNVDIPVLVRNNEIGEASQIMALDCEYVGAGADKKTDILARVSIVNDKGKIVYDKYVRPTEKVTDFRTSVSGIRPYQLKDAPHFKTVQQEVSNLLEGRTVVGHAVHNDFRVLQLRHGQKLIRDTAKCSILRKMANCNKPPSLKRLAKDVLGIDIQQGEHDSITDARVALRLYEAVKKQWEAEIKRFRR